MPKLILCAPLLLVACSCTSVKQTPTAASPEPTKDTAVQKPVQSPSAPKDPKKPDPETIKRNMKNEAQIIKKVARSSTVGQSGWNKSAISAIEFVRKVDAKLASLKAVSWGYRLFAELPDGQAQSRGSGLVETPSKFYYEFTAFSDNPTGGVNRAKVVADGQRAVRIDRNGVTDPKPIGTMNRMATTNLLADWPLRFNEYAFAGIGSKQRPFTAYLTALTKPGSGFTVTIDERSALVKGQRFNNERIIAQRKNPPQTVEMIFDANYLLPVSIHTSYGPKGRQTNLGWGVGWNLNKGQRFDATKFDIPSGPF